MSLAIDVDTVTEVLLADGWHHVADESFSLDSYEYLWSGFEGLRVAELRSRPNYYGGDRDPVVLHAGGNGGICSTGFTFKTPEREWLAGPLSSILAIKRGG